MNAEISRTQRQLLDLYREQQAYLAGKPRQFVLDLQHEADDVRKGGAFSLRTAAEINYAACTMILEK